VIDLFFQNTTTPEPARRKKRINKKIDKGANLLQMIETGVALGNETLKLYNIGRGLYRRRFNYSVKVSEKDALYSDVHAWLMDVLPHEKHKSLEVATARRINRRPYESSVTEEKGPGDKIDPIQVRFNDKSSRSIMVEGHKVTITLITPETADREKQVSMMFNEANSEIIFDTYSYEGQQAVIRQLEKLNQQRATTRKAVLKMMNQWGSWSTRSDLPPRTMDSVSLPKDQKNRVVSDLGNFLDSEDQYNRLAIPWHRGYMFYGPPGTGKTSLVKALANQFNLDLWYISLSDLKSEHSLLGLLADVGPRSMLLLEDIDTIKITHDRDASEQGQISMGSLLNTLDGVATPHGLITVMTTNRFDILDPALTRAGRMDLVEELGYPTLDTVQDMFVHFYGDTYKIARIGQNAFVDRGISTAMIAEIMKRHMENPVAAVKEIEKLIKETK
jgi:hypothetical protein